MTLLDQANADRAPAAAAQCCTHCGLPVPPGLRTGDGQPAFCCTGCETVHAVIRQHGLDSYYGMRSATNVPPQQAPEPGGDFAALDHDAYTQRHVRTASDGTRSTELLLDGMHCAACVWLVENISRILPGVQARVDYARRIVRIRWQGDTPLSTIAATLARLGYPPQPVHARQTRGGSKDDHRFLVQLAIAAVCAGNGMLLAFALYSGLFDVMAPEFVALFRYSSMFFGLVALLGPGQIFLRSALGALRTRTPHLDVPVAVGLLAAAAAGTVNTFLGRGEIYFDSLTMLVFLLLIGRWVQRHQQRWVANTMDLLLALTPATAQRLPASGANPETVPVDALRSDDLVLVPAGGTCPADGTVARGASEVDLSLMTGETRPVPVEAGSGILAGVTNLTAPLEVRITATGAETRLGQLLALVDELTRRKSGWVRLADRLAGVFVVTVLLLAAATVALWFTSGVALALDHAVALVIVACPCALGLATPLTVAVALGRAARAGVLIKGGDVLERLTRPGLILFDKTGTLTHGAPELVAWQGPDEIRPAVVALERCASHPLARAWVAAWQSDAPDPLVRDFRQSPRGGIRGTVDGRDFLIGQASYIASACQVDLPDPLSDDGTIVHVVRDGVHLGQACFRDTARPEATDVLARLRANGWRIGIASGDQHAVVSSLAESLGVPPDRTWSGQTPEDKLALVQRHMAGGPVVMVGDGVNDAAALSAATVGIAVRGGAEASLLAADVYLQHAGLRPLLRLLDGAGRTTRVIRAGLAASLSYNAVAVVLAMAGLIHPLLAAILMPLSSLSVVALAATAPRFAAEDAGEPKRGGLAPAVSTREAPSCP